jgi:putative hydrolase of the HAD superfamily
MEIKINVNSFFIFDLDDTLFSEVDFLKSAYKHIATKLATLINADIYDEMWYKYTCRQNVFEWIVTSYHEAVPELTVQWLLKEYREHMPGITLSSEIGAFLQQLIQLSIPAGLITDGRSITQRNKLKALGIDTYFKDIVISEEFGSEKPDERNYLYFQEKYPGRTFYFFGDNPAKDFIVPARLGWQTICVKDTGNHIHKQVFNSKLFPDGIITSFEEIKLA